MSENRNVRIAAVGDLHCTKTSQGKVPALFQQISQNADILPICRGTLLSRTQYLYDIEKWGYLDARLRPPANLSLEEVERWTQKAMQTE